MKFRCERDALTEAVGLAARAVATRPGAHPALTGIEIQAAEGCVELQGSDLDLAIRVRVPAEVGDRGRVVVPARLFEGVVNRLRAGTVAVEIEGEDVCVTGGSARVVVRVLPADEFPRFVEPEGSRTEIEAGPFLDALRQVIPAASRDDARPILTGVLLASTAGGLRLVATDSYRLAVRDVAGLSLTEAGGQVLVGARELGEVQRTFDAGRLEVVAGEREVQFSDATRWVRARRIEGDFPNYEQLIPAGYPNRLTVAKSVLEEAIRLMQTIGERDTTPVRFSISTAGVEIAARSQDRAEASEVLDAKYEGNDVQVAFNPQFLLDGVLAVGGDEVMIELVDNDPQANVVLKPALIRGTDGSDFRYILMPVRVS